MKSHHAPFPYGPLAPVVALATAFLLFILLLSCGAKPNWTLTFEENFNGTALDPSVWVSQKSASGHIASARFPENNVVSNGFLYQVTRKEKREGKEWTTASIWTRFSQRYGRFECCYKYGGGTGLNNAFWITVQDPSVSNAVNQVVDVNKGRYSNQVYLHLHRKNKKDKDFEKIFFHEGADLAGDFHTYTLDWLPDGLTFYIDGKVVGHIENTEGADELTGPAVVHLSTAVMPEAGPITDDLIGRSMVVDWVRVYKQVP